MKVLLVHNYYQQAGGEDAVFREEVGLLRRRGHDVHEFTVHNDAVDGRSKLAVSLEAFENRKIAAQLRDLVMREGIQIAHFHNTFPMISPASYGAVRTAGAAVVQTLHNYRLICPKATLFRNGVVCEDCVGKRLSWPSVMHRCYRDSIAATTVTAAMLSYHDWRGTWRRDVDRYVALTQFAKQKLASAGLPDAKIAVKPNFVDYDGVVGDGRGGYALFAGRLAPEKGVETLLDAWKTHEPPVPLWIVGDGPLGGLVGDAAEASSSVRWLGLQTIEDVGRLMNDAAVLILPSYWYEGFPRTIVEAYSRGLPVIASRLGSMTELIHEGDTGYLFEPHDPHDLMQKVRKATSDAAALNGMRAAARKEYEQRYTADQNYEELMAVYREAIGELRRSPVRNAPSTAEAGAATTSRAVRLATSDLS